MAINPTTSTLHDAIFPVVEVPAIGVPQTLSDERQLGQEIDDTGYKFIELFPLQANQVVTQRLIVDKPKTFWDLFNVGTNVLTHHMSRNSESTHTLENSLYGTMKKWALTEVGHA